MGEQGVGTHKRWSNWGLVLAWAALLGCVLTGLARRSARIVAPGEVVQYDDFAFAVRSARLADLDGRRYLVVTLDVHNRAQRVDFRFDPAVPRLVDREGGERGVSPEGLRALERARSGADPCAGSIPAGASCTTAVAFDPPADLSGATIRIRFGGRLGGLLDDLIGGRRRLALGPIEAAEVRKSAGPSAAPDSRDD